MLTTRLSYLLVTLPLVALLMSAIAVKPAFAAGAAEEAVRILSKARTADGKCSYLSASERNELQRSRPVPRLPPPTRDQHPPPRQPPPPAGLTVRA